MFQHAATLIWSVYPPAIVYARLLLPESLFVVGWRRAAFLVIVLAMAIV